MTSKRPPRGLGYESPTQHTVTSALAASHLIHRLNELDQNGSGRDEASGQHATVDEVLSRPEKLGGSRAVSIKDRIACFQWTWFTSTMATGGIANVLASGKLSWYPSSGPRDGDLIYASSL